MADDFDPLEVTLLVTEVLDRIQVPYLIVGSVASILYGMVRTTNDVDLVARLGRDRVAPLADALESGFYLDRDAMEDAIKRRGMFNLIHLETMFKVDVYVQKGRSFDEARFQRRTPRILARDP